MSGARQGDRVTYTVVSSQSVSGLNREAAVQYRGIPVGKVVALEIDPSNPRLVRIQLAVDVAVKTWIARSRVMSVRGMAASVAARRSQPPCCTAVIQRKQSSDS